MAICSSLLALPAGLLLAALCWREGRAFGQPRAENPGRLKGSLAPLAGGARLLGPARSHRTGICRGSTYDRE